MTSAEQLVESCRRLRANIEHDSSCANFTCGGKIKIGTRTQDDAIPPVIIRFDSAGNVADRLSDTGGLPFDSCRKIELPVTSDPEELELLLKACQPASFGRGGHDVYDESVRKAGKLDEAQFSTNFSPYVANIIRAVERVLLPSYDAALTKAAARAQHGDHEDRTASHDAKLSKRIVRAELYKLNIYSGPSGKFSPHVDTPRSTSQFGSLVVCLPCEHEGGQLVVRHDGRTTTHDWAKHSSEPFLQWAAFYSDCEHEVLPVTSGHRITLTYNLYCEAGSSGTVIDLPVLPLYEDLALIFKSDALLPEGGFVGIPCRFAYAHTSKSFIGLLPGALKGTDMVIWSTLEALGLNPMLRPVIRDADDDAWASWKLYGDDEEYHRKLDREGENCSVVGLGLCSFYVASPVENEGLHDPPEWPHERLPINWLADFNSAVDEPALAYLTYGNESSVKYDYSAAAIIVQLSALCERTL